MSSPFSLSNSNAPLLLYSFTSLKQRGAPRNGFFSNIHPPSPRKVLLTPVSCPLAV